jgi:Phage integrase family.
MYASAYTGFILEKNGFFYMEEDQSISDLVDKYEGRNNYIDFEEFWTYWKGELSDGSIVQYLRYLSHLDFDPTSEDPNPELLEEETDFELEGFKEWCRETSRQKFGKEKNKKNTRNRFQYYVYLATQKYLKAKDCQDLIENLPSSEAFEKPVSSPQTIRYDYEQIQKIISEADSSTIRLSVTLMAYSGLRVYEILNMTPKWLEFKQDRIEIRIPGEFAKGKKSNVEPEYAFLSKSYSEALKDHIRSIYSFEGRYEELLQELTEGKDYETVFNLIDRTEKTFEDLHKERYQLNRFLRNLAKKAGVNDAERISAHKLRKSFIHQVQDKTRNLSKTAQLARHKDPSTTHEFYLQQEKKEKVSDYKSVFS